MDHAQSVKVYTVNGASTGSASSLPDWLVRKRAAKAKSKRATREHVEGTIELIQHFDFPEASNHVKSTRDGHHLIATGTYKPQMRVWDLDQLALKFERHTDIENVDFTVSGFLRAPTSESTTTKTQGLFLPLLSFSFLLYVHTRDGLVCCFAFALAFAFFFSPSHFIENRIFTNRYFRTTGRKRSIYRPTVPSSFTPRAGSITVHGYRALAARSLTISPAATPSLARQATKCTVSISSRAVS
jgi:WD40 repeat protein